MKTMVKSDLTHLSFRVEYPIDYEGDGEYIGLCSDFPSLSFCAPTFWKALRGIKNLVWDVVSSDDAQFGHFYCDY